MRKNSKWRKFIDSPPTPSMFDSNIFERIPDGTEDSMVSDTTPDTRLVRQISLHKDVVRVLETIDPRQAEIVCLYLGIDPKCLSIHSKIAEDCFESEGKNEEEITFSYIASFYHLSAEAIRQKYEKGIGKIKKTRRSLLLQSHLG